MSRKKVKKEVVKRKTNIYDPMGVYGRGLTENQRLGMTRQMKIENMAIPKPVITRELLKEYGKILDFYGMYPERPTGTNITIKMLEMPMTGDSITITNGDVLSYLKSEGITPGVFYCDSFAMIKDHSNIQWDTNMTYHIIVGNSIYRPDTYSYTSAGSSPNDIIPVPAYFMINGVIHFQAFTYDSNGIEGTTELRYEDLTGKLPYTDFVNSLPQDGAEIPYLLYPNSNLPELKLGIEDVNPSPPASGYILRVKLVVMY